MSEKEQKQGWFKRNWKAVLVVTIVILIFGICVYWQDIVSWFYDEVRFQVNKLGQDPDAYTNESIAAYGSIIASFGVILAALASLFTAIILVFQLNEQRKQRGFIAQQTDILSMQQKAMEDQLEMLREERFTFVFDNLKESILKIYLNNTNTVPLNMDRTTIYDSKYKNKYDGDLSRLDMPKAEILFQRMIDLFSFIDNSNVSNNYKQNFFRSFSEDLDRKYKVSLFCYLCLHKKYDSEVITSFSKYFVLKGLKVTKDWQGYFIEEKGVPEDVINSLLSD